MGANETANIHAKVFPKKKSYENLELNSKEIVQYLLYG